MKKIFFLIFIFFISTGIIKAEYRIKTFHIPFIENAHIKVDGNLDEEAYKHAFFWDKFVQTEPGENIKPTEKTEMFIFHTGKEIVVGFKCYDNHPEKIKKLRRRRDNVWSDIDSVAIAINTFGDCKQFYIIAISSMNDVSDSLIDETGGGRQDIDIEFKHATRFYNWGWTIELVIPFSSINLKVDRDGKSKWYFNAQRYIPRDYMEIINSMPYDRNSNDVRNGYVILEMDHVFQTVKKRLKLIPETVYSHSKTKSTWGQEVSHSYDKISIGLTGEYNFSSDTVAKFTIHPDFSQIEADDVYQEINNRYPVYFKEKRPFFMDGMESFSSPIELVYTRNIVKPEYGLKFSTRKKGFGFAIISAMEKDVPAERFNLTGEKRDVYWNVLRGNYTFSPGSYIGGFFILRNFGSFFNQVSSIDGQYHTGKWEIYYQGVSTSLKTLRHTIHGKAGSAGVSYKWNKYLNTNVGYSFKSPDYFNDLGFVYRNNVKEYYISQNISYIPKTDKGFVKTAWAGVSYLMEYLYNSDFLENSVSIWGFANLKGRIGINGSFSTSNEQYKGKIYPVNRKFIGFSWNKHDKFSPFIGVSKGSSILYGDNPLLADKDSFHIGISSEYKRLHCKLTLFAYSFKDKITGKRLRRQRALQINGEYFFTDRLSIKTMYQSSLPDYRDYGVKMPYHYFYLLLTWQKDGFRKIYAGITNSTNTLNLTDNTFVGSDNEKMAFLKVSWLF